MSARTAQVIVGWPSLPGLAGAAAADGAEPGALAWLLARADRAPAPGPWRDWLLADAALGEDVLARFPAGPCVRAEWCGGAARGAWACAAPVHLLAGLDRLRLASPAPLPLADDESVTLAADLNTRLDGAGFVLHAVPGRGWLCECPAGLEWEAPAPDAAVGGDLRELLPCGRDARRVRAWINEAQMALHDHPLNRARERRGLPVANSVWLWGPGEASPPAALADGWLLSDDDWLSGLWRLHGGRCATPAALAEALAAGPAVVRVAVAGPAPVEPAARQVLQSAVLGPLREALREGAAARVEVHAGRELLVLDGRARWRFWRRPRPLAEAGAS